MEYNIGDNVTLKVDITGVSILKMTLSSGWFYNSTPIRVCSDSSHYVLSNDSKNLTIVNASAADVGVYEARVTSYQFYTYSNKLCDKVINEVLEHHAAFAPVIYTLRFKSKAMKQSR